MKKIVLFALIVLISIPCFSQNSGDLKNKFYLRFGLANPSWKYYGYNGKIEFPPEVKRFGGAFELGSLFMINRMKIMEGMRLGINIDYLSVSSQFLTTNDINYYNLFIGSKIGPSLSFSPVKSLCFDVFAKLNPIWAAGVGFDNGDMDKNKDVYVRYIGMKYSAGVNLRWSFLMFGFEYNPGSMKLKNEMGSGEILGNLKDQSDKTPLPAFNISLGFCL